MTSLNTLQVKTSGLDDLVNWARHRARYADDVAYGGKAIFDRFAGLCDIVEAAEQDLNAIKRNPEAGFTYWRPIHEYTRDYGRVIVADTFGNFDVDQRIGDVWENAQFDGWAKFRLTPPISSPKWRSIMSLSTPKDGQECICYDGEKTYRGRWSKDAFSFFTRTKPVRGQIWMPLEDAAGA